MKKYGVILLLILTWFLQVQAMASDYKLKKTSGGYCYFIGDMCISYFTEDENYKLPQDRQVAEDRFRRRQLVVEDWYRKNAPQYLAKPPNKAVELGKAAVMLPLAPVLFTLEGANHNKNVNQSDAEKVRLSNQSYLEACQAMHAFIVQDCIFEKSKE